eukprot:3010341-Alexandrium_andersonii.AAC.1
MPPFPHPQLSVTSVFPGHLGSGECVQEATPLACQKSGFGQIPGPSPDERGPAPRASKALL